MGSKSREAGCSGRTPPSGNRRRMTLESLVEAAYDSHLTAFDDLLPALFRAYDGAPASEMKTRLADPVAALRGWDNRWAVESVPTSLAVLWGRELMRMTAGQRGGTMENMSRV